LGPHRPNVVDLSEATGLSLDDIEDLLGKGPHELQFGRASAPMIRHP
jgi:hypothetical protein